MDLDLLSCCPALLYQDGGLFDNRYTLSQLMETASAAGDATQIVQLVFEGSEASRGPVICPSEDGGVENRSALHRAVAGRLWSPPSYLICIKNALIWNNMLFSVDAKTSAITPIYETYRMCDRPEQGKDLLERIPPVTSKIDVGPCLFVGSSGSFNYGHWMVDDFSRMVALSYPQMKGGFLLSSSFNPVIDEIRRQGAELFLGNDARKAFFLDRKLCYSVENLYYVTPTSYHPSNKNKKSVSFTRDKLLNCADFRGNGLGPIFANRAYGWSRQVTNLEEIRSLCRKRGIREIVCENFSLIEQVRAFAGADCTFGIMGAALVNQIFQERSSACLHMALAGWDDPFYWDLTSQLGRAYLVEFGPADTQSHERHFQRSFYFDPGKLDWFLDNAGKLFSATI